MCNINEEKKLLDELREICEAWWGIKGDLYPDITEYDVDEIILDTLVQLRKIDNV